MMSNQNQDRLAVFDQILNEHQNISSKAQQARLGKAFTTLGNINTLEARKCLEVLHPSGRIKELKAQGWDIEKVWVYVVGECGLKHRIANYFLKGLPVGGVE